MPRTLLILLLVFAAKVGSAQDYLGKRVAKIKKEYYRLTERNDSFTVVFKDSIIAADDYDYREISTDTIAAVSVFLEGFEKIDAKYFFHDYDNWCDSAVLKFYCGICANNHLKEIIGDYSRGWRSIDSSNYYSIYNLPYEEIYGEQHLFGYPRMKIIRTLQNPVCVTVIFYIVWLEKEKLKQLKQKK